MKNLAKLIKSEVAPQALYVHCFALCKDLYALVGISPKEF